MPITAKTPELKKAKIATRLIFLLAGAGLAAWAPLVPFAKIALGVDEATLGMLLLCLGLGSITAMPLAGALVPKLGARVVIAVSACVIIVALPLLTLAQSVPQLAIGLALFGAGVGSVDVAMNIHAIEVEKRSGVSLLSGFHGLFTLGSIFGAGGMSLMLIVGLNSTIATVVLSISMLCLLSMSFPHLMAETAEPTKRKDTRFALPGARLIVISLLCFLAFLAEGVVLDWGALLLIDQHQLHPGYGGLGYAAFAVAMTAGRLTGDRVVTKFGGGVTALVGGLLAAAGYVWVVVSPDPTTALIGFATIGLGASNIVPVFFSAAGRMDGSGSGMALSMVTSFGYAGILVGPAVIGFMAEWLGIGTAFLAMAIIMLAISAIGPAASKSVAR
ncbi:MFS transporter [Devosia sp. Root685]|uniref:MFS transporter n=1 Tax=Devosia sp. Root685 TaxID=1736587 RepID=UPI000B2AD217|nr:MFS transporter [Devosia sp. Root685]